MKEWISESVAYWNNIKKGAEQEDNQKDTNFLNRYDEMVELAKKEYDYEPPNDYYREGYNLYKRMYETREDYVLFLKDKSVSPTNNIAERYARVYKRKNIQAMCFRSKNGVKYFCDGLSVIQTIKNRGENLFIAVTNRFNKQTEELLKKVSDFDVILTSEAKGIPLAYEMSRQSGKPYVVARKSVKVYMTNPISVNVKSITTKDEQMLHLGDEKAAVIRGKRVLVVDDVISTGESLSAMERLIEKAEGIHVQSCAVLAEGDAADRTDIVFLEKLPLFFK